MTKEAKVTTAGTARMNMEPNAFNDVMKDMTRLSLARCLETSEHPCRNRPQTAVGHSKTLRTDPSRRTHLQRFTAGMLACVRPAGGRTELQGGNQLPTPILIVMVHRVVD